MNLTDALKDIEITFLQLEFAIKLLSYCELGKIVPLDFDTDQTVLLENGNLGFPAGHFSDPDNIIRAANVSVSLAFGASALTLDKAFEVAGIKPEPSSDDMVIKLRTLVYMVRCAYAHGIADPRWDVRGEYQRAITVELDSKLIEFNFASLNGEPFDFDHLGGHHIWFQIRDKAISALTAKLGESP
jgi:hypothetical protein